MLFGFLFSLIYLFAKMLRRFPVTTILTLARKREEFFYEPRHYFKKPIQAPWVKR